MTKFYQNHLTDDEVHLTHLVYEVVKNYSGYIGLAAMVKLVVLMLIKDTDKSQYMSMMSDCWDQMKMANDGVSEGV